LFLLVDSAFVLHALQATDVKYILVFSSIFIKEGLLLLFFIILYVAHRPPQLHQHYGCQGMQLRCPEAIFRYCEGGRCHNLNSRLRPKNSGARSVDVLKVEPYTWHDVDRPLLLEPGAWQAKVDGRDGKLGLGRPELGTESELETCNAYGAKQRGPGANFSNRRSSFARYKKRWAHGARQQQKGDINRINQINQYTTSNQNSLSTLRNETTKSITTMSTSTDTTPILPVTPNSTPANSANFRFLAIMPRPGQPGAMEFDGRNVTEFLEDWDLQCEDYGLSGPQKCARFPNYCTPTVKELVKLLPGYTTPDWDVLRASLKEAYWQHDKPKNTPEALIKLVKEAPEMDLNIFLIKFTAITDSLIANNSLSSYDRVGRLLDGLPAELRSKVLDFCAKKSWKLSPNDTGTAVPNFDELKGFVLTKARAAQKKTVYNAGRAIREGNDGLNQFSGLDEVPEKSATPGARATSRITTFSEGSPKPETPATTNATPDPIAELTKQFSQLALLIQGNMGKPAPVPVPENRIPARIPRCVFCDSTEHSRRSNCSEFGDYLRKGRVYINNEGRIVDGVTKQELPTMFGKGGMIKLIGKDGGPPAPVGANSITLDCLGRLGDESSVRITHIDFETGVQTDEIVDAEVYEKRRREEILKRRVRPRTETNYDLRPAPTPAGVANPDSLGNGDSQRSETPRFSSMPDSTVRMPAPNPSGPPQPASEHAPEPGNRAHPPRKFKLESEINKKISVESVGEQLMDTMVSLPLRNIVAVAPDVSNYIHEQTRKRRVPLQEEDESAMTTAVRSGEQSHPASVSASQGLRTFYACPSPQAKVILEQEVKIQALLDPGSEINMMPRRVFEKLGVPIDTRINWAINTYEGSGADVGKELTKRAPIGVCHSIAVDVGGVEVNLPVFVVESCSHDLILGRPWERATRAEFVNEDDGSLTVIVKSQDGRRIVEFCGCKAEHERNREFARHPDEPFGGGDPLKV
jgi:hypothetical protein